MEASMENQYWRFFTLDRFVVNRKKLFVFHLPEIQLIIYSISQSLIAANTRFYIIINLYKFIFDSDFGKKSNRSFL